MKTELNIVIDSNLSVRAKVNKSTTTEELQELVNRVGRLNAPKKRRKHHKRIGRPKGAKKEKVGRGRPQLMSNKEAKRFCRRYEKKGKTKAAKMYGITTKQAYRRYEYYKNTKKI